MKLIVDTHALIWMAVEPARLSDAVRTMLERSDDDVFVSAASAYEIDFKRSRDPVLARFPDDVEEFATSIGLVWAPITAADASDAARLPLIHRDPWDRLIVAQAIAMDAAVLTVDAWIARYPVATLW